MASRTQCFANVVLLVQNGANIHHLNNSDDSALTNAIRRGDRSIVYYLIAEGAKLTENDTKTANRLMNSDDPKKHHLAQMIQEIHEIHLINPPPTSLAEIAVEAASRDLNVSEIVEAMVFTDNPKIRFETEVDHQRRLTIQKQEEEEEEDKNQGDSNKGGDDAKKSSKIPRNAIQTFCMVLRSFVNDQERNPRTVITLWKMFKEDFDGNTPDLLTESLGEYSLAEFMILNRVCLDEIVETWGDEPQNSRRLVDILRGKEAPLLSQLSLDGEEDNDDNEDQGDGIDEGDEEKKGEESKEDGKEGEEDDALDSIITTTASVRNKSYSTLREDYEIVEKAGIDSSLFFMTQLVLGVGDAYNASWIENEIDDGIPIEYWPKVFLNLIINSPKSHELVAEFLNSNGFVNWNGKGEAHLYPSPIYLPRNALSWSGLSNAIPTKAHSLSINVPSFCYAWKFNPTIGSKVLMDPRVTQALSNSPVLDTLVDVPVIHYLFEYKWRSWGLYVTRILFILYAIFIATSNGMLLWVVVNDDRDGLFVFSILISGLLMLFQLCVETWQMYGVFRQPGTIVDKLSKLVNDYFMDLWNVLDLSIILVWIISFFMYVAGTPKAKKQVFFSIAALVFWSKVLYFGRGVKAYAILIEVLKTIVKFFFVFLYKSFVKLCSFCFYIHFLIFQLEICCILLCWWSCFLELLQLLLDVWMWMIQLVLLTFEFYFFLNLFILILCFEIL